VLAAGEDIIEQHDSPANWPQQELGLVDPKDLEQCLFGKSHPPRVIAGSAGRL
jgi:hypothetical protein